MLAAFTTLDGKHSVDILRIWNGIEECGADPTQDSAVRADSQGQRKDGRKRKARRAPQLPQCV
jgi:hypothetical protein